MRVAVFLDGANFFFMQKDEGWFADPKKVLDYIKNNKALWKWRFGSNSI